MTPTVAERSLWRGRPRDKVAAMSTANPGDRLMTLAELAGYLHMGKKTVLKLVSAKKVPGVLFDREWRFRRADIDEWLSMQQEVGADFEEIGDGMEVPLGDLMPQEAIVHDLQATDALTVIEELAAHAYSHKWLNDKPWFIGALVEREALASTAMEGGIAFLHTRSRDTRKIRTPFVICGRSHRGIDFGAPDGKPTNLFFLLGLKYDKLHLPILGRLARLTMRNPTVVTRLRATTSPLKMRNLLLMLDADELSATPTMPAAYRPQAKPVLDRRDRLREIMRLNARKKYDERKAGDAVKKADRKAAKKQAAATVKAAAKKQAAAAKKASESKRPPAAPKSAAVKKRAATDRAGAPKSTTAAAAKKSATGTASASKSASAAKKTEAKSAAVKKSSSAKKKSSVEPAKRKR